MVFSVGGLVGRRLSDFHVEKHEHPSGSSAISELPIKIWIMASEEGDAVEISAGPSGCNIEIRAGKPNPVDMAEYGRTLLLPQFLEEHLRSQSVTQARIEPFVDGEKLILKLSDGSELSYACSGDDELRPSIDQSQMNR